MTKQRNSETGFLLWNYISPPFFILTLGYCGFLFYISSLSSPVQSPFPHFDKIVHFCLYAGLGVTVAVGLRLARHDYSGKLLFVIPLLVGLLYGLSDETHQLFVRTRTFGVGDLIADAAGAAFAAAILLVVWRTRD